LEIEEGKAPSEERLGGFQVSEIQELLRLIEEERQLLVEWREASEAGDSDRLRKSSPRFASLRRSIDELYETVLVPVV